MPYSCLGEHAPRLHACSWHLLFWTQHRNKGSEAALLIYNHGRFAARLCHDSCVMILNLRSFLLFLR